MASNDSARLESSPVPHEMTDWARCQSSGPVGAGAADSLGRCGASVRRALRWKTSSMSPLVRPESSQASRKQRRDSMHALSVVAVLLLSAAEETQTEKKTDQKVEATSPEQNQHFKGFQNLYSP